MKQPDPGDDVRPDSGHPVADAWRPLQGKTVLLVEEHGFIGGYVGCAVEAAGAAVVGPCRCADEALAALDTRDVTLAYVGLDSNRDERLLDELGRRGIGHLVTCSPSAPASAHPATGAPVLQRPFAAFQVIELLATLAEPRG